MTTTKSATAAFLARAIEESGKTQREIARDAGFGRANVISMMKKGDTKVPVERIPALARACGVDPARFLEIAMEEYHSQMWQALRGHLGEVLSPAEQELLALFRFADLRGEIVLDDKAEVLLAAVFEMLVERARSAGGAGQGT